MSKEIPVGNRYRKVVTRKGRVKEVEGANKAKQSRRRVYHGSRLFVESFRKMPSVKR